MTNQEILARAKELEPWLVGIRRKIHQHAEPSNEETATQALVRAELEKMEIQEIKTYFGTGLAAVIRGGKPGKTIAMRADLDALRVQEETGLPFASQTPGVMHACGHDGHTAILLGVARLLSACRSEITGNVKLIFQPAEENGPQGGGAKYMIAEGVLTDAPAVDAITGLHLLPNFPVGTLAGKPGPAHAGSDPIYLDILGSGGHASQPQQLRDPVVASAYIITALQTVLSRNVGPFDNAVVGISMIEGGTRHNIVPDNVHMRGTIRTFSPETRQKIGKRITEIVEHTAKAMDVTAKLDIRWNYGPLVNDEDLYGLARDSIRELLGKEAFLEVKEPMSFGEDFSYFAAEVPAIYLWLGARIEDGIQRVLHSSTYDINEQALTCGVQAMSRLALDYLGNSK